ncbi:MAG TPA: hypothetical protein PKW38_00490 [Paludibacteraceae bacterium]|nr:hypothetical protein [Paludibacteraceae bacterium]
MLFDALLNKKKYLARLCWVIVFAALPWILMSLLSYWYFDGSIIDLSPLWSDELSYWHESLSFSQKGFNFGYYTFYEELPNLFSFGTHGIGTISVYAFFANFFGPQYYLIPVANAMLLSFSFIYIVLMEKDKKKLIMIFLFISTFTPLLLYINSSMSEILNYSLMLIYVLLMSCYSKKESRYCFFLLLMYVTIMAFVRVYYVLLFIPILYLRIKSFSFKFWGLMLLLLIYAAVLYYIVSLFVSPYPFGYLTDLFNEDSISAFMTSLCCHFCNNLGRFFLFSSSGVENLQRYYYFIIMVSSFGYWYYSGKVKRMYFIIFGIMFLFMNTVVCFYDVFDWRDFRTLSPILLSCVVFFIIECKNKKVLNYVFLLCVVANVFVFIRMNKTNVYYETNKDRYIDVENCDLSQFVKYRNGLTKYDNTILVTSFDRNLLLSIPIGLGITFVDEISDKYMSKYACSDKKINLNTYQLLGLLDCGYYLYKKKEILYNGVPEKY